MQRNGFRHYSWILWVITYGITYLTAGWIDENLGTGAVVRPVAMTVYTAGLTLWCYRRGMLAGHHRPVSGANLLQVLPLAIPVLINLACSGGKILLQVTVIPLVCAAVCEEIFFRVFLLRGLSPRGQLFAMVMSSAVFAGFHLVNLIGSPVGYVCLQAVFAFAVGMAYGAYAMVHGTVLMCMISHAAINLTGTASTELRVEAVLAYLGGGLICALYGWLTLSASKKKYLEEDK